MATIWFDSTNTGIDDWGLSGNWWTTSAGSGGAAYGMAPQNGDVCHLAAGSPLNAFIQEDLTGISVTCDIIGLSTSNPGVIASGLFTGSGFSNGGGAVIKGGIFSGSGFTNLSGSINGGIFSGSGFSNQSTVNSGIFSGTNFINDVGTINGGIFCGTGFTNSIGGTINGGFWLKSGSLLVDSHTTVTGPGGSNPGLPQQIAAGGGNNPYLLIP